MRIIDNNNGPALHYWDWERNSNVVQVRPVAHIGPIFL